MVAQRQHLVQPQLLDPGQDAVSVPVVTACEIQGRFARGDALLKRFDLRQDLGRGGPFGRRGLGAKRQGRQACCEKAEHDASHGDPPGCCGR